MLAEIQDDLQYSILIRDGGKDHHIVVSGVLDEGHEYLRSTGESKPVLNRSPLTYRVILYASKINPSHGHSWEPFLRSPRAGRGE